MDNENHDSFPQTWYTLNAVLSVKSCAAPKLLVQHVFHLLEASCPWSGIPDCARRSMSYFSFPFPLLQGGRGQGGILASCSGWTGEQLLWRREHNTCFYNHFLLLLKHTLLAATLPFPVCCLLSCPLPLSGHVVVLQGAHYHPPWKCFCTSNELIRVLRLKCNSLGWKASEGCSCVKLVLFGALRYSPSNLIKHVNE